MTKNYVIRYARVAGTWLTHDVQRGRWDAFPSWHLALGYVNDLISMRHHRDDLALTAKECL